MPRLYRAAIIILALTLSSCSEPQVQLAPLSQQAIILAFGDSLTYGTGANSETESYPAILQNQLNRTVINAGIPGETSAEGLARLPEFLEKHNPHLVILCHGGNDLLRRLDKAQLKSNLKTMVKQIEQSGAEVVLLGVPTFNFGFEVPSLYQEVANEHGLAIELDVIAEIEAEITLKSDRVHPNAKGYAMMASRVSELLRQSGAIN